MTAETITRLRRAAETIFEHGERHGGRFTQGSLFLTEDSLGTDVFEAVRDLATEEESEYGLRVDDRGRRGHDHRSHALLLAAEMLEYPA